MQLIDDRIITPEAHDIVCRERALRPFLFLLLSLPLGLGLLSAAWFLEFSWGGLFGLIMSAVAALVLVGCGVMTLLIAGFCADAVRAALAPSNWLLRARPEGLFVRYRSFQNGFAEPGQPAAVFLSRDEIAWLQALERTTLGRDAEGRETRNQRTELIIRLTHKDTTKLAQALIAERSRAGHRRFGIATAARHYPVRLGAENELIVDWAGPDKSTHPRLTAVLPLLAAQFPVQETGFLGHASYDALNRAEQEAQLADLVAAGDLLSATKIARELYGLDTSQARIFVEQLRR